MMISYEAYMGVVFAIGFFFGFFVGTIMRVGEKSKGEKQR